MSIVVELPDYVEVPVRSVCTKKVYDGSGVYIFIDSWGKALYVGKTVSFKRRMRDHMRSSEFYRLAKTIRLYYVRDEFAKDIYETYAIKEFKPEYNMAKTFYERMEYEDMLHEIEFKISEVEDEIYELENEFGKLLDHDDDVSDAIYDDEEDFILGESLYVRRSIAALEKELRDLRKRKGILRARLSS